MAAEVIMPALGMAQETGKVLRWLKAEGERVHKGEPLLEIETDKVTVDIESPADGTLGGISAREGEEVRVGLPVAFVLAPGEDAPLRPLGPTAEVTPASSSAQEGVSPGATGRSRRRLASPKARRLAKERGIDIDAVAGSGPGGAVTSADLAGTALAAGTPDPGLPAVDSVWRVMAERTTQSWQSVPHFYLQREVDADRLLGWRESLRDRPDYEAVNLTDLLVRLVAEALVRHPRVNSSWREGSITPGDGVNVALAVATETGLAAPVIHHAERLQLPAIAARRREIAAAARQRRLRPEDVAGGTFTISNLGMYGVDSVAAIVNAPQAAILAVGRVRELLVPVAGGSTVRAVVSLSVSFDHRVVDGVRGAEFLRTLASLVEEPAGLVQ